MPSLIRRNLLATAAGSMGLAATAAASTEQQPPFGPTAPPLAGAELPSFRFRLGPVAPKTYPGGWAKEATVAEFPVSEKLAGVSMLLHPGAAREMHWHANAAEWAYVLSGRCRVTTIDPNNHAEVVEFGPGDVWYFPRGHGHAIQAIGTEDCRFILVFDNGYFSEFGTFSASDWISRTPPEVLARNFGVPAAAFATFPKSEVYIAAGPVPPEPPLQPPPGSLNSGALTHRYRMLAQRAENFSGGTMRVVSEREFPISETMTGALLRIRPGGMREMHWHPNADEWQYYIAGQGRMTVFGSHGRARTEEYQPEDVGYVPTGYGHYIENTGTEDLLVLLVLNNGTYQSISLNAWMANTPADLLATNYGQPAAAFASFPTGDVPMPERR